MNAFIVITPSGVEADGAWRTREEIPEVWHDCFNTRFFVEDGEVREITMTMDQLQRRRRMAGQSEYQIL